MDEGVPNDMPDRRRGGSAGLMTEISDRDAVALCRAGAGGPGHPAFRVLYERYAPEVMGFLVRLLGDRGAAEDAVQDTFVRLHGGLKSYDPERPLKPYVLAVARNVAIDALRSRKARPVEPLGEGREPLDGSAADGAARNERREGIEGALAALAPEHRSIIVLRYAHGLTQEAVAESLSCTVRTVRNRLRAAGVLFERELRRRGVLEGEGESETETVSEEEKP